MKYQKVKTAIWNDEKFTLLSPNEKLSFLYLLTSPFSNPIGAYVIKKPSIVADTGLSIDEVNDSLKRLIEMELVEYDEKTSIIFIKNYLKHNRIENPKWIEYW